MAETAETTAARGCSPTSRKDAHLLLSPRLTVTASSFSTLARTLHAQKKTPGQLITARGLEFQSTMWRDADQWQDHLVYPFIERVSIGALPHGDGSRSGQSIIHAIKPLAISTGPLKTFLSLHFPPIDLVVYEGPSFPKETETLS